MKNLVLNLYYGALHVAVSITSIILVSTIVGFNLPNTFLFVGIGTLVFKLLTRNKISGLMGVSGSYLAGIIYITQTYGKSYALGGIIISGLIYCIFGLIMLKYQDKVLQYIPKWLLSTAVMFIGLMLVGIGKVMIAGNIIVGVTAMAVMCLVSLFGNKKLSMFAIPVGILVSTLVQYLFFGIDTSVLNQQIGFEFVKPMFNLPALTMIGIVAIPVLAELLGDMTFTGLAMGKNLFKEVGVGKIALGNGIGSIISGLGSSLPITSYSESASFIMLSGFTNPNAQIVTSFLYIAMAFATPLMKAAMAIPKFTLGGIALGLYALIIVNSLKEITKSIDLDRNKREATIITLMVASFFIDYTIKGISINSIAVAVIIGLILNLIIPKTKQI